MGNVTKNKEGKLRKAKWDWTKIENLILAGKSNREILEMPEFDGMSYDYLKNKAARLGLHSKKQEVAIMASGGVDRGIAERRTEGIERHHLFTFEQLDKMRNAILDHKVKGSVKDLKEIMTLFQSYIDAAEQSYGLKGMDVDSRAISLNAMVSLHISPPQRDEGTIVAGDIAFAKVDNISEPIENARESIAEGDGGSDFAPTEPLESRKAEVEG